MFASLNRLQKNPNFHISDDHTYGYIDNKLSMPSYDKGTAFAEHGADAGENVTRFGREGQGNRAFATIIDNGRLDMVLKDAKKNKLLGKFAYRNDLTTKATVSTSTEQHRPVILSLGKRSYIIAPVVENTAFKNKVKGMMGKMVREHNKEYGS